MKFLHLGDLHLGKTLGEFDLIEDQSYALEQVLAIAKKHAADAILIAGDVYDRAIPSEGAVRILDRFLSKASENGLKVFLISGNHDSDERLNFGSSLLEAKGIHISAIYDGTLKKQTFEDEFGEVNVWMLPFVKASVVRHYFPEEKIENYDQAVRVLLSHTEINTSKRNILVAHQFVAGRGENPQLAGSENIQIRNEEQTQSVGLVDRIGYDCFDAFDYVALGHIHSPQKVGREEVRYSGSLLKYSLSEVNNEKSVPVITVGEKGTVSIELEPLKPMRDVRHIKGKLAALLDPKNITQPQDFIFATLTDEDMIGEARGIFQQYYPNTVRIMYDNQHSREIESIDVAETAAERPFPELIADFYRKIYGCEISDEELALMMQIAGEAGAWNETDET